MVPQGAAREVRVKLQQNWRHANPRARWWVPGLCKSLNSQVWVICLYINHSKENAIPLPKGRKGVRNGGEQREARKRGPESGEPGEKQGGEGRKTEAALWSLIPGLHRYALNSELHLGGARWARPGSPPFSHL